MDVEQLIEKLGRPLSSCFKALWVGATATNPARIMLITSNPSGDAFESVLVPIPDGLTDADGMALAKDFNEFLRAMNRLKEARRG